MTYNRDPDPSMRGRMRMRRDDGGWGAVPILLVVAIILGAGYFVYSADWNANTNQPITKGERTTGPTTTTAPPATSTPPATTPKQP
jgi:hypothetical protein